MAPRRSLGAGAAEAKEGATGRMEAPGGAGWHPDRVMPVGAGRPRPRRQRTAATWPAPGGEGRARPCAARRGKKLGRASERTEIEAGRPSSACPPFLSFFYFFFPNIFQAHFDLFKIFSRLGP